MVFFRNEDGNEDGNDDALHPRRKAGDDDRRRPCLRTLGDLLRWPVVIGGVVLGHQAYDDAAHQAHDHRAEEPEPHVRRRNLLASDGDR